MLSWFMMQSAAAAIFAGNPGQLSLTVTSETGPVLETSLQVFSFDAHPCDTNVAVVTVPWAVGLDAATDVDVPMPAGDFCAVTFHWAAPSTVWVDDQGFEETLDVVVVETTVTFDNVGGETKLVEQHPHNAWLELTLHP